MLQQISTFTKSRHIGASKQSKRAKAGLVIYTDGSARPTNPGPAGWGYAVYKHGKEIRARYGGTEEATNNRMELNALRRALRWVEAKARKRTVVIRTDSQLTADGYNAWIEGWARKGWKTSKGTSVVNDDRWKQVLKLKNRLPNVTVEWVKGHAGDVGNDRADELAELGRLKYARR